jgi:hypothetical protein
MKLKKPRKYLVPRKLNSDIVKLLSRLEIKHGTGMLAEGLTWWHFPNKIQTQLMRYDTSEDLIITSDFYKKIYPFYPLASEDEIKEIITDHFISCFNLPVNESKLL